MKKVWKHLVSVGLLLAMLLNSALALDLGEESGYGDTTIEVNTKFDFIMQFVDWFSLDAEGQDVLRQYFNSYFEQHPEEFTPLVNDIMQSIDEHSRYLSSEQYAEAFGEALSDYVGIGIGLRVLPDGKITIDQVFQNSPASASGLQVGDIVLAVGGKDIAGMTIGEVSDLLAGAAGSSVTVLVSREEQQVSVTVPRARVTPEHVSSRTIAPHVEYIRVSAMGSETDTDLFVKEWNSLPEKGIRSAIVDLRGNGGGLVSMAQTMIETMVPRKDALYLGLRYRENQGGLAQFYTPGGAPKLNKIVILVDGGTASAAEIVSGSLSDLGVATLVGTQTYGKGVGQFHFTLPDDSKLILTSMEIQLPQRGVYNGVGLTPDIVLENTDGAASPSGLDPLDTTKALLPGTSSASILAMSQRLAALGFLDHAQRKFDASVLDAVFRFQVSVGQMPQLVASSQMLQQLQSQTALLSDTATDAQLAAALKICMEAAKSPAQYTVQAQGSWTNNT